MDHGKSIKMSQTSVSEFSDTQRERKPFWFYPLGWLAQRTTLMKRFSSHGIQSLEWALKSYSSRAWSSSAWKSGWLSKLILITNLLYFLPTYTTKWPFGTSFGMELSSCMEGHKAHWQWQQYSQPENGETLLPMFLHLLMHSFKNFPFIFFMFREFLVRERRRDGAVRRKVKGYI